MTKKPGQRVRGSDSGRPIMTLLDQLGQRWTLRILWELRDGERLTFRELQNRCDNISPTILNKRLKELRELKILDHQDGGYRQTSLGKELGSVLLELDKWSRKWARQL